MSGAQMADSSLARLASFTIAVVRSPLRSTPRNGETSIGLRRRSGFVVDPARSLIVPPRPRPRRRSSHPALSSAAAGSSDRGRAIGSPRRGPRLVPSPPFTIMFDTAASARPGSGDGPCSFSGPRYSCCTTRPPLTFLETRSGSFRRFSGSRDFSLFSSDRVSNEIWHDESCRIVR